MIAQLDWLRARALLIDFQFVQTMGSLPSCCDCSEVGREGREGKRDEKVKGCDLQLERLQAARKLFELTDLNDDGLISVDEFALMGLNQTKVHCEKRMTLEDEQRVRDVFVQRFRNEIDSSFRPINYAKYQEYILRAVNNMDPGDFQVR